MKSKTHTSLSFKWFIWLLLAPPLGGWGVSCSSRKATFSQTDSLTWIRRDSLALSRSLQVSIGQSVRMRHYTFSPPDSAGRQYVESATLLSATTDETYTEQATGERKQTAILTEAHAEQSTEHTGSTSRNKRFPYWIVAVGVAVGIVALYLYYIYKCTTVEK